jgi:hypothetical protein
MQFIPVDIIILILFHAARFFPPPLYTVEAEGFGRGFSSVGVLSSFTLHGLLPRVN